MKPLYIFYEQERVGTFHVDQALHMDFQYSEAWLLQSHAFPLSLSLPLQNDVHRYPLSAIFLENLLPEQKIRRAIEQAHKLPEDDPYHFLKEFGADLAGAFVIAEDEFLKTQKNRVTLVPLQKIRETIAEGRQLYQSITDEYGTKFSLAGAQDKFCVIYQDEEIYVSLGKDPSTHIAKVNLDFHNSQTVYNEYFCMKLAAKVGLPVPPVTLIADPALLIVERYDRKITGNQVQRLHQEDFCQVQSLPSAQKYQDKGGPGLLQNYEIVRQHSAQPIKDLEHFLDWIAFNLIIGNNDSHSKNISLLYHGNKVRLAPFYDLLSTSVYGRKFSPDFAFKIGSTARYAEIRQTDIQSFETSIGVRPRKFLKNMSRVAKDIEKYAGEVGKELKLRAPDSTIGVRIQTQINQRLQHFREHGGLEI